MPALTTDASQEALRKIRNVLGPYRFDGLDLDSAVVLHYFSFGCGGWIAVIGHPEDGSYEWVAKHSGSFVSEDLAEIPSNYSWSNEGWGGSLTCLREGLVAMADWY